ncbi:MAG: endonuclease [Acidimicrobiaceae bacterium]|nr:endonuclease [Acidimicrobiaceae bacterium]MCS5673507.1 endonuclease NucS [Acidimicrobiales bacterium]MEE2807643.1 endonuclease NucS [Actinomycetota bacterium]
MRLVIAKCTVDYSGRLDAHLSEAVRLIMVKADGCVAVHADGGAYKPLNWMNAPNHLREYEEGGEMKWTVTNEKKEQLTIQLHEILSDFTEEMGLDPGLQKDGVEAHLQELLAANVEKISAGMVLVRREYPTDIGPVDLLCRDVVGTAVAIEIKRRGEIDGVEQLSRYLEYLNRDGNLRPVSGIFAAQEIKPQARVLAEDRGIKCLIIDYDELRGIESNELKLF